MRRGMAAAVVSMCLALGGVTLLWAGPAVDEKAKEAQEATARAAQDYFKLGLLQAGEGQDAAAAAAFRQALAIKPQWAEAHSLLGSALARAGSDQEAEAELRKAVALKPDYAEGWYYLGQFLKERGREQEAQEAFNKAKQYQH